MNKKIINRDVLLLIEAINMLEAVSPNLPIKIFYANNKNKHSLEKPFKDIQDVRVKLMGKYGIKDEKSPQGFELEKDGKSFAFKTKEDKEKFIKEFDSILEEEVKLDLYKININSFEGVNVSKADFPLIDTYFDFFVTSLNDVNANLKAE